MSLYKTLTSQKKEDFLDMQELRIKQVDSLIGIINADNNESTSNFNQRAQDVVIKKLGETLESNALEGKLITDLPYLSESTVKRLKEEGLLVQKNTKIMGGDWYIIQCRYF